MEFTGVILTQILEAVAILIIGLIVARIAYWIVKREATKFAGIGTAKTMAKFVEYILLTFGLTITVLVLFGINSTTIAIISGAVAFALTFGFQNVIQNVVGGLLIAIDGRVQLGDWIEVGDQPLQSGPAEVLDIGLTSVTVRERYGRLFVIPSSYLTIHKVLNYSEIGCVNLNVSISLPWTADPNRMLEIFLEEARRNPFVYPNIHPSQKESRVKRSGKRKLTLGGREKANLDFEESRFLPSAHIVRIEDDKLEYNVSLWIDSPINYRKVTTSYQIQVVQRLNQEGIKMIKIFHE
jgi:potassium efflux system protein